MRFLVLFVCLLLAGCAPRYAKLKSPAEFKATAPATYYARFETTRGEFVVEVRRDWAPLGADRFYNLVRGGFYDGTRFFRVRPGFVVQWGLNGDPAVNAAWGDATRIEDDRVRQSNQPGFISFATSGPNTRTTQVFVNLADNARLDKMGFSPLGKVVSGMDVFSKLYDGYGEGAPRGKGPDQKRITAEGEAYLAKEFPKLDRILKARVTRQAR